jgi:hypothetical protein
MQKSDEGKFFEIMTGLGELYGKEVSSSVMELWFRALEGYDIEAISAAASAHVSNPDNGQFFPKPADIVKMISGTSKDSAFIAWSKVEKAVERVGSYHSVVFDDPIIHKVIQDMGGWIVFGEKTYDEWPFVKNEFITRYQGYKSKSGQIDHPGKLIGIHEANNRKTGHEVAEPVLIGDERAAMKVLEGASNKPALEYKKVSDVMPDLLESKLIK